ncbi:MAG: hypothetical protein AAFY21_22890, partial [Cyanobacteria bacterium J06641_2]
CGTNPANTTEDFPQLRNIGNVEIISFRPGKNPFDSLAVALKTSPALSRTLTPLATTEGTSATQWLSLLRRGLGRGISSNGRLEELELEVNLENDEKALCRLIEDLKNLTPQPPSLPGNGENSNSKPLSLQERGLERGSPQRFVIIADQFEELYTSTEESKRQSFLDLLLYTIQNTPLFSLVLTLRADFLGKVLD